MPEFDDEDQVIVQQVLEGKTRAVRRMYHLLAPRLRKLFVVKVADSADVDELIQDTFLHLLDALPLFRFQSNLWTFASSIARHELSDYWRKRYAKRIVRTVPIVKDIAVSLQNSVTVSRKMNEAMNIAYARMKPIHVQILRFKYEDGKSVKEIAAALGLSVKSAEAQLYRARKAFQEAYVPVEEY